MVADGSPETPVSDPQGLRALGFVGISDPIRPTVPDAVRRCQAAGVSVVMITGDHPATARAIARESGLLTSDENGEGDILTGDELATLDNAQLERALGAGDRHRPRRTPGRAAHHRRLAASRSYGGHDGGWRE